MSERYELYIHESNNDVAITDTVTERKYSTLEDIIGLLNNQMEIIQYREDHIARTIVDLIMHYNDLKETSGGLVLGDAFTDRVNVLIDLAMSLGYTEFLKNNSVL